MSRFFSAALMASVVLAVPFEAAARVAHPSAPSALALQRSDEGSSQAKPPRAGAPPTPGQTAPPPPAAPVPMAIPPPPPPAPLQPALAVNIQLEFTITDQSGSGPPDKKTVSMMALNGSFGRIRAGTTARPRTGPIAVHLNVDARPLIVGNGVIQTEITIEYRPVGAAIADEPPRVDPTVLNQSLTVVLQNGKPLVITQAADPVTDRRMVVEVKATVMK